MGVIAEYFVWLCGVVSTATHLFQFLAFLKKERKLALPTRPDDDLPTQHLWKKIKHQLPILHILG